VIFEVLPDDFDQIQLGTVRRQLEQECLVVEKPSLQCVLINAVMDARVVEHDHSRTAIALADQRVEKFDDIRSFHRSGACGVDEAVLTEVKRAHDAAFAAAVGLDTVGATPVVTSFAERAAPHGNLPRRNRTGDTDRRARHIAACPAYRLSTGTPLRCAFFERVAIAFEREAFALECLTERFDPAWQRFSVNGLHALSNLRKGQRLGSRHLKGCGDHCVRQRRRPATVMAAHQAAHPAVAPCVGPVVDALSAHTELFDNHLGLDPTPEHQQTRSSRARVPMSVIDRQLLQGRFHGFAQFYNTLHPLPRHHERARIAKFKSIDQEHSAPPLISELTTW
jgi:hypothetical protein